jgi:hypothetical protein
MWGIAGIIHMHPIVANCCLLQSDAFLEVVLYMLCVALVMLMQWSPRMYGYGSTSSSHAEK